MVSCVDEVPVALGLCDTNVVPQRVLVRLRLFFTWNQTQLGLLYSAAGGWARIEQNKVDEIAHLSPEIGPRNSIQW